MRRARIKTDSKSSNVCDKSKHSKNTASKLKIKEELANSDIKEVKQNLSKTQKVSNKHLKKKIVLSRRLRALFLQASRLSFLYSDHQVQQYQGYGLLDAHQRKRINASFKN